MGIPVPRTFQAVFEITWPDGYVLRHVIEDYAPSLAELMDRDEPFGDMGREDFMALADEHDVADIVRFAVVLEEVT